MSRWFWSFFVLNSQIPNKESGVKRDSLNSSVFAFILDLAYPIRLCSQTWVYLSGEKWFIAYESALDWEFLPSFVLSFLRHDKSHCQKKNQHCLLTS